MMVLAAEELMGEPLRRRSPARSQLPKHFLYFRALRENGDAVLLWFSRLLSVGKWPSAESWRSSAVSHPKVTLITAGCLHIWI
jgi:hypothetical protein